MPEPQHYGRELTVKEAEKWHAEADLEVYRAERLVEEVKAGTYKGPIHYGDAFKDLEAKRQDKARAENAIVRAKRIEGEQAAKAQKQQEQEQQDRTKAQQHEAELKAEYQARWNGTPEQFNQAWPQMYSQILQQEAMAAVAKERAALRASYGL